MKPVAFAYRRPHTVDEALDLLAEHGDDARVLAGGQSLVPLLNQRVERPAVVVDINRLDTLTNVTAGAAALEVGALVRQYELEAGRERDDVDVSPLVASALPFVGHVQTRNRGTICGSIAFADPMGQIPLVALVGGASVQLRSIAGDRDVALDDFLAGPFASVRRPDELVVGARLSQPPAGAGHGFAQLNHNVTLGVAAATADRTGVRVAIASGVDRPRVTSVAEPAATPRTVDDLVAHVVDVATRGVGFRSDVHADADYRQALAAHLVERALRQALDGRRTDA